MIKKLCLLDGLTILVITPFFGQFTSNNTDSLIARINKTDKKQKALLYNQIAQSYLPGDPKNCINYAVKALKASSEQGNAEQKGYAYKNLGAACYNLYQFDEALKNYENARNLFTSTGNKSQNAAVLINIGLAYREKNNYDAALLNISNSLGIYRTLNDVSGISSAQNTPEELCGQ